MKKDFSQDFDHGTGSVSLIVRDANTKRYHLFISTIENQDDFISSMTLELEPNRQTSAQLAKYLYENGLVLANYRELTRQNRVSFSFIDDEPGVEAESICMLVEVDVVDGTKLERPDTKSIFVTHDKLQSNLSKSPYFSATLQLGLTQLAAEEKVTS